MAITACLYLLLFLLINHWYAANQQEQLDQYLHAEAISVISTLAAELSQESDDFNYANPLETRRFRQFLQVFQNKRANKPTAYKTTMVVADSAERIISSSNAALNLNNKVLTANASALSAVKVIDDDEKLFSFSHDELRYRILQLAITLDGQRLGTLRLACLLDPVQRSSTDFLLLGLLYFFVSSIIHVASTVVLVNLILHPVRAMSQSVKEISERNLGRRLDSLPGKDELAMLASTFNQTLDRIEQAYGFQERLVTDLAHQLRTPLTSLRGANELALEHLRGGQDLRPVLEGNLAGIDRITSFINTMLTLAKLEASQESLRFQDCDLAALLADIVGELEPLWLDKDIAVGQRLEGSGSDPAGAADPLMVEADAFYLKQAFVNVLANAYRYTPPGGAIDIAISRGAYYCTVAVANNGPAIAEADLPRLFNRYFQSKRAGDLNASTGFGLGLNIAKRILDKHHGSIRAYNPPGGGAAFEFTLPLRQNGPSASVN